MYFTAITAYRVSVRLLSERVLDGALKVVPRCVFFWNLYMYSRNSGGFEFTSSTCIELWALYYA